MVSVSSTTPSGTTPEMLEARLSSLSGQLESTGGKVREDVLNTLIRDLHNVEGLSQEFHDRLTEIMPDLRRAILEDKIVFMEQNPCSFLYNYDRLQEELDAIPMISESDKSVTQTRIDTARGKSVDAKREWLGEFYQW